jgi:hypothetical protein
MSEFDDELVRTAFQRFEEAARHHLPLPDRPRVRAIAGRRRIERTTILAAALVLALVLPVAAFAALTDDRQPPVVPLESPTPGVTSTAPSPDAAPMATASTTPSAAVQGGWLTKDQLRRATVDLPEWGPGAMSGRCPKGRVKLADLEQYNEVQRGSRSSTSCYSWTSIATATPKRWRTCLRLSGRSAAGARHGEAG